MSKVLLQIYEFDFFHGIKEYHAEVVVFDKSISYSDEGIDVSDQTNKDGLDDYKLCATFDLGYADIFEYEFQEYCFPKLEKAYTAENYGLFKHNCRFFALDVIKLLQPTKSVVGIQVLEDLNQMSAYLGKYLKIKTVGIITFLTSFSLSTAFQLLGTCFPIPMIVKDILIITLFIILSFVPICRR